MNKPTRTPPPPSPPTSITPCSSYDSSLTGDASSFAELELIYKVSFKVWRVTVPFGRRRRLLRWRGCRRGFIHVERSRRLTGTSTTVAAATTEGTTTVSAVGTLNATEGSVTTEAVEGSTGATVGVESTEAAVESTESAAETTGATDAPFKPALTEP
ncbi:hypothetical protein ACHAWO_002611 [Cyclotella atomus]|uniref:Uncharacterized protein n=1 Tax=Cyclotella atomus TaxID=382360 RepID=A0ABD3NIA5_9STRA